MCLRLKTITTKKTRSVGLYSIYINGTFSSIAFAVSLELYSSRNILENILGKI